MICFISHTKWQLVYKNVVLPHVPDRPNGVKWDLCFLLMVDLAPAVFLIPTPKEFIMHATFL